MAKRRVTLIPGDGVGPSLVDADVMEKYGTPLPEAVLDNIRENKIAYKGPITTPVGSGFRSVNVALRKELGLYA